MTTTGKTSYEVLGVPKNIGYPELRLYYRKIIHDHKQNKISADNFHCKVRAYETLSDS
jgi:DnaJ-class molecular chaperone